MNGVGDIEFSQFLKLSGLLASEPNKTGKYRVVLELYNDSEIDGIVSLVEQRIRGFFLELIILVITFIIGISRLMQGQEKF